MENIRRNKKGLLAAGFWPLENANLSGAGSQRPDAKKLLLA
jgi:hypothetical protein